jgi:hypothetical protein
MEQQEEGYQAKVIEIGKVMERLKLAMAELYGREEKVFGTETERLKEEREQDPSIIHERVRFLKKLE